MKIAEAYRAPIGARERLRGRRVDALSISTASVITPRLLDPGSIESSEIAPIAYHLSKRASEAMA